MTAMFDRYTLYAIIWRILEKKLGDCVKTDYLTDLICDAVAEWVPKQGDFWLNRIDNQIYVNTGTSWEKVTPEAPGSSLSYDV